MTSTHPGSMIRDDLAAAGYTISDAARMMQVNRSNLTFVLNGGAAVRRDLAYRLSMLLHPNDCRFSYAKRLLTQQADFDWCADVERRGLIAMAMNASCARIHQRSAETVIAAE